MIDSITRITLNLQETNTMVSIQAKRGDTGRKLLIHLSDGSLPYHISDECYAVFTAKKPDGTKINNPCTIENNVIEYEFTEQTCAAVGTMKAEIRLYGADSKMITSACFLVNVYDTVFRDGDAVSSEDEMNTLDALILQVNELLNETGKTLRWHGNWNSEANYEANDLVLHQKVLYVAEAAVAAGVEPGSESAYWMPIAGMGTGNGGNVDMTGYATEQYVKDYAQPKGDYLESTELTTAVNDALAQAKESGEFDGADGQPGKDGSDGVSPTVAVSKTGKVTTITITDVNGTKTATIHDGEDGAGSGGTSAQVFYTTEEATVDEGFPFDPYQIETNGKTINVGDWIVTPSGKVFVVIGVSAGMIDANYDATLHPDSGGNVAYDKAQTLTDEQKAQARANIGAQPAGNYLTEVPEGYAKTEDIPTVPTKVSAFTNDAGYLTEHQDISGKLDADKLPEAVNDALAQAKESGQFDGQDGKSPTVAVSKTGKVTTITITDVNGTKTATINDGEDGTSSGGNTVPIYYTTNEPQIGNMVFDPSEIETNGKTINVGDWIVTPSGKVYVVAFVEDYGIEANYDETLHPDSGGNVDFQVDETLSLKDGVLSVNTTNDMEQDNTLPITSAGVFATVGNIEALLKTI